MTGFPPQMMYAVTSSPVTAGLLFVWGTNTSGELGLGDTVNRSSPVQLGADTWAQVSFGTANGAGIKADGSLWAWGANTSGQLGQNNTISRSSPVQIGTATDWVKVMVADSTIMAINSANELWMCGANRAYTNPPGTCSSPIQILGVWDDVVGQVDSFVGKKADGTLWTWGSYEMNGLTNATITSQGPTIVSPGNTVTGLTSGTTFDVWATVSSGGNPASNTYSATYRATDISGNFTVNETVTPSNGKLTNRVMVTPSWTSSPVQTGAGTNTWTDLFQSVFRSTGGLSGGDLYVWGLNAGALGIGTVSPNPIYQSFPTMLPGTWSDVAFGSTGTIAIRSDGSLWAWGNGSTGQLGQNNTTSQSSPVQVGGATDWESVSHGNTYWIAKKTDGTVFVCGGNTNGSLGINAATNRSSPVQLGVYNSTAIVIAGPDKTAIINAT